MRTAGARAAAPPRSFLRHDGGASKVAAPLQPLDERAKVGLEGVDSRPPPSKLATHGDEGARRSQHSSSHILNALAQVFCRATKWTDA
eukprot:434832-Pyramimonas_sp.AAC.1